MGYQAEYSDYSVFNRFENLDGIEAKIIQHLINSNSKHADNIWKLLKYGTLDALNLPTVEKDERKNLICTDNGNKDDKRVFVQPFSGDAWPEQCSFICVHVGPIDPVNHMEAVVDVIVDVVTHNSIAVINGNYDILDPQANPNDSNEVSDAEGSIVVAFKNRETVLLKSVLAELNGLYLDGNGYIQLNAKKNMNVNSAPVGSQIEYLTTQKFYNHRVHFYMGISGVSESGDVGY